MNARMPSRNAVPIARVAMTCTSSESVGSREDGEIERASPEMPERMMAQVIASQSGAGRTSAHHDHIGREKVIWSP